MVSVLGKLGSIRRGNISAEENVRKFLEVIKRRDKWLNAFICVNQNAVEEAKKVDMDIRNDRVGRLAGLAIAVKSNISVKGMYVTCGSRTLDGYKGAFDADVIARIKNEGGVIIGMTNMDEFACGASGETSAFGPTQNPAAEGLIPGGSSSGSAAAVAAGMCDVALGADTGGSIRNPASHCGIVGVKPSYGRVSRYGLVDMAMSLEGIGPMGDDVYGNALLLEVIAGRSMHDAITRSHQVDNYTEEIERQKRLSIGLSNDFEKICTDKRIYSRISDAAETLADSFGEKVKNVKLGHVDLAIQTYYPIAYVEFFSATRKFDGRKYGRKIEDVCGEEVLRRILGGREISKAEYHGAYYRKALVAKELIRRDFERAFKSVDIVALPATPMLPHKAGKKISDPRVMYAYDAFTTPANLAGICGGVVPAGQIEGAPIGLQLLAPSFREADLLRAMAQWEKLFCRNI